MTTTAFRTITPELETLTSEPYYQPVDAEVAIFEAAASKCLPVLLKGPDRLRQDALRRIHGLEAQASAGDGGLP